jgi:hypothetical protein
MVIFYINKLLLTAENTIIFSADGAEIKGQHAHHKAPIPECKLSTHAEHSFLTNEALATESWRYNTTQTAGKMPLLSLSYIKCKFSFKVSVSN